MEAEPILEITLSVPRAEVLEKDTQSGWYGGAGPIEFPLTIPVQLPPSESCNLAYLQKGGAGVDFLRWEDFLLRQRRIPAKQDTGQIEHYWHQYEGGNYHVTFHNHSYSHPQSADA